MLRVLVAGAVALIASGCALPDPSPELSQKILALRAPAAGRVVPAFVQGGPAEIVVSQQFILHSKHVGADYLIQVALPILPSPDKLDAGVELVDEMFPNRDAAAIYVLDGISDFPKYAGARDHQLIIGIQPMFTNVRTLYNSRIRDLTHVRIDGEAASGGGEKFAAFLKDELKPFIESRFPVDPGKAILAGYSLGGMFALRVLADDPQVFSGYLIGDPSSYDKSIGDRLRASVSRSEGVHVYLGVADLNRPEVRPLHEALVRVLKAPDSRLVLEVRDFPGETHSSAVPFVIAKGLSWMSAQPALKPAR